MSGIIWKQLRVFHGGPEVQGRQIKLIILLSNLAGAASRAWHFVPEVYSDDIGCSNYMTGITIEHACINLVGLYLRLVA